jgi:parallel beta-helix repeat protein
MTCVTISDAGTGLLNPPFNLTHMTFRWDGNGVVLQEGAYPSGLAPSRIETSVFDQIARHAIELGPVDSAGFTIANVAVSDSGTGLFVRGVSPTIQHSSLVGNITGIRVFGSGSGATSIVGNSIVANRVGIDLEAADGMHISDNNIYGNTRYNLKVTGDPHVTLDAFNNYWGGLVGFEIAYTIDECGFNPYVLIPCVNFKQILSGPSPDAPVVAVPKRGIAIDDVLMLQTVMKQTAVTNQHVKLGDMVDFLVLYHLSRAGTSRPAGQLSISCNGKRLFVGFLIPRWWGTHPALSESVVLGDKRLVGTCHAQVQLTLGSIVAKRERTFYVSPK